MSVITLTTDWGTTDYFVGALKGEILTGYPGATLVDISHAVEPHDLLQGAFILRNAWRHFPKGTVHVCGVSAGAGGVAPLIAVSHQGHYFIGTDNGFYAMVFDTNPDEGYFILDARGSKVAAHSTVIASSAVYLAKGGAISEMGAKMDGLTQKSLLQPVTEEQTIRGSVIYIDSVGNLVTNIDKELFNRIGKGRDYNIVLRSSEYTITEISNDYFQAGRGGLLALYNEAGLLEIAISHGNAAGLIGMSYGDIIRIEFK